jgi:hypothetical protein
MAFVQDLDTESREEHATTLDSSALAVSDVLAPVNNLVPAVADQVPDIEIDSGVATRAKSHRGGKSYKTQWRNAAALVEGFNAGATLLRSQHRQATSDNEAAGEVYRTLEFLYLDQLKKHLAEDWVREIDPALKSMSVAPARPTDGLNEYMDNLKNMLGCYETLVNAQQAMIDVLATALDGAHEATTERLGGVSTVDHRDGETFTGIAPRSSRRPTTSAASTSRHQERQEGSTKGTAVAPAEAHVATPSRTTGVRPQASRRW